MLIGVIDISKENFIFKWRRNVKVGVVLEEREVIYSLVIRILFYEVKYNYVNGLYFCKDYDVYIFVFILIFFEQKGKYDLVSVKFFLYLQ